MEVMANVLSGWTEEVMAKSNGPWSSHNHINWDTGGCNIHRNNPGGPWAIRMKPYILPAGVEQGAPINTTKKTDQKRQKSVKQSHQRDQQDLRMQK
ncbi:hypothetical protein QBC46DRAFT_345078 [Diplogelasinospora grovesii]|uniref:Uncharacterized protein n=1 Tax=Diplogelasinospora grovesii TaxID=303347 RepID=A0AAN6S1X0_9PEZI|nr:hypothetical protein QBC46DRAFT_345078 [Diplogelasinospora grovesii]